MNKVFGLDKKFYIQNLLKRRVIDKASQCMLVELSALGIHTL